MTMGERLCSAALLLSMVSTCSAFQGTAALGSIHFPTSGPPAAQARFIRGVLLLHSFQYREARAEFQAARRLTPAFAMAYWGEALTYNEPLWFAQDPNSARAVLKQRPKAPTERESAYLKAAEILYGHGRKEDRDFAYAASMRRLHESYPEDDEAAAFYALALLGTSHGGRNFRTYMQAAAIAEDILARNGEHPGALHYAIHCYDDPVHAPLGLRAARVYARIAPEASHALHMPSHIFFAMGMWDEAARANEKAFEVSQRSALRDRQPMEPGGYHAIWWLQYVYLQQGRRTDARAIRQKMEQLAAKAAQPLIRFHLVHMRAMYSVETGEPYDAEGDIGGLDAAAVASHFLAAGMSALNRDRRDEADRCLQRIRSLRMRAEPGSGPRHDAHSYVGDQAAVAVAENELAAMLLMADGKSKEAIDLMKIAAAIEDKTPYEFGPPVPPKPVHELLGEMLLSLNQPQLAGVQFELALLRMPKRALSLRGLARAAAATGVNNSELQP